MIIKFVVEVEGEDFPFTLNTDRLPGSIGNNYLCLKEFEICDDENESGVECVKTGECNCDAWGYSEATAGCPVHGIKY